MKLLKSQMKVIREEIKALVIDKAMRKLTLEETTNVKGYYIKMFCVAKPDSGKWRYIINIKPMNTFLQKKNFKLETVKHVR